MSNNLNALISNEAMLDDEEDDESFEGEDEEHTQRHRKPRMNDDSSEEEDEDEDEEEQRRVAEGFIVDEDEDEELEEAEARRRKKKRRREREAEEQLDEDDLDLIGETMPSWDREPQEKPQFKRIKRRHHEEHDRAGPTGLEQIFSDEEDYANDDRGYNRASHRMQADELDDFIEDDYPEDDEERLQEQADLEVARPGAKGSRTGGIDMTGLDPESLEDMQLIFGSGDDYDWALDMEETQEDERREKTGIELKDVFEPSQLAEKLLTDEDNEIRGKDEPERFQLDRKPYEHIAIDDNQFKEEARWIVALIWPRKNLPSDLHHPFSQAVRRVIEFIVVDLMEVPYIFQHKKDYLIHQRKNDQDETIGTEKLLNQTDLWKIVELDIKFKGLVEKRNALETTYENIKSATGNRDQIVEEMIYKAATMEELQDIQDYINFRYSKELREIALTSSTKGTKRPGAKSSQWLKIRDSDAFNFVKAYGLSATQLGLNALGEAKITPGDERKLPMDLADDLCDGTFDTSDAVMAAARQMFAEELTADPMIRKYMRQLYYGSALISSHRTEKGLRRIDDAHPYYEIKYLMNQSIMDLARRPELFLKMARAEEEGLIEIRVQLPDTKECIRRLVDHFKSDNMSEVADAWNEERAKVIELAFPRLDRVISRGVKDSVRTECQDAILLACRLEYTKRLDQAPYKPKGLALGTTPRILAFSNGMGDGIRDPLYWASVEDEGRLLEHGTFTSLGRDEAQREAFAELVLRKAPDVIAVSGFSADAHRLVTDLNGLVRDKNLMCHKYEDQETGQERADLLEVVIVNDEVARLYKDSLRGTADLPNLHPMSRYCFGLCRYMQNPLKEYAALQKDIITIRFHACQNLVPQDKLMRYLETAMVDMVNLVGVEINEAVNDPYTANLLPYVSGLGPRKAMNIVKLINAHGGRIASREELVGDPDRDRLPLVGPRIFNNCASFLYIEYDSTDPNADPLDNTRVHPEDYELGRKMAADALELYDEDVKVETDEHGPAAIVRMLFRNEDQEKVNDLVLEEYAEQLEQKFQQRKRATLETIRAELLVPYEELRNAFTKPDDEFIFQMFTGETKESLRDQIILPAIVRLVKDDYALVKIDCGLEGRVGSNDVAHRHTVKDALQVGQTVRGVITKVDRKEFSFEMSLREESIRRAERAQHGDKPYNAWDAKQEDQDRDSMQVKDKMTGRAQRVIKHPLFKSFNKTQAEEFLGQAPNGDAIIRPSSLGNDHITVTWKVYNGVFQHLDVLELEKENEFSVGKKLRVGSQIYSDLDELIVDHVKAMSKKVEEMMRNDKWHDKSKSEVGMFCMSLSHLANPDYNQVLAAYNYCLAESWLSSYCAANPNRSNYRFCIDPKHPGYFFLLFKASKNANTSHWMVRVIPQGYEMMKNKYPDMKALCNGFKLMFQAEATKQMSGRHNGAGGRPPPHLAAAAASAGGGGGYGGGGYYGGGHGGGGGYPPRR
ncbi:hypothetical protein MKZ38_003001 [Zalerion maritima]|uniref:Transcription elongation factor Spt6 n=1 Tax=Zalerion maritima TaxID=339359 RepID=A0AAD5RP90_9PEZI|nr:hypothetical protein MKZ38_003001 [Zalerion maritima]